MAVRATLVATVAIDPVQAERRVRNFFTHFAFRPDLKISEKCFFRFEGIKILPNLFLESCEGIGSVYSYQNFKFDILITRHVIFL